MRFSHAAVAVLFLAVSARPASATTLQPGDVVVYDYNFLGGPFAPPYDHLVLAFNLANVTPTAIGSFTYFDSPGASGLPFFSHATVLPPALLTEGGFGFGAAVDGVFSVRVLASNLPFEILSTTATAFASPNGPPLFTITGTVAPTASVPEPATLALLGSGVAARLMRRKDSSPAN